MIDKLFKKRDVVYPLMRDPQRNPKCYDMTEEEREEAIQRVDEMLSEQTESAD